MAMTEYSEKLKLILAHDPVARPSEAILMGAISTISKVVGAKDPNILSQQIHVARLSAAIAMELEWDSDKIKGLYCGAMIYDIGKVGVPAEILNKPRYLNAAEFKMVQGHTVTGFNILQDIQFPWPVAKIAYQHHERLDGSGYPQGLTGEKICDEAKIVAVADVVKAMSSHRPYRTAFSTEVVIEEMEFNKGRYYDSNAVDACTYLIREKGYLV